MAYATEDPFHPSHSKELGEKSHGKGQDALKQFTELFSLDDLDLWEVPDGPVIRPPKHIDAIIKRRKLWNKQDDAFKPALPVLQSDQPGGRLVAVDSEFSLRKDFFKLSHAKNVHHSEKPFTFPREYAWETTKGGSRRFMRDKEQGWFQLKRVYNPDVFECMAEYIVPIENFEFYAAFEVFLSYLHNSELVMRVTSKEDLVEIWSRNFASKLQEIIGYRPSTFHTVVIPLILKPITSDRAVNLIEKEWNKNARISCFFPAASIYGRCVNRWILPLTQTFNEGPNGRLKKPPKKSVRLDLGYLFHQRRLEGKKSNSRIADDLEGKNLSLNQYYHVIHRTKPGRRFSDHKKFLIPFGHSSVSKLRTSETQRQSGSSQHKQSASAARPSTTTGHRHTADMRHTIGSQRGTLRTSAVPGGSPSMISLHRPKFNLERLLMANQRKATTERVYWLAPMRHGRHQPPKVFAKLTGVSKSDDDRRLTEIREEFLNNYLPFAYREKYQEPQKDSSLIYPQYENRIIRGMLHDEIAAHLAAATNRIRDGKDQVREVRRTYTERSKRLKEAMVDLEQRLGNQPGDASVDTGRVDPFLSLRSCSLKQRKDYFRALDKEIVLSDPEYSEDEEGRGDSFKKEKARQLVGNTALDVIKHWTVLSNELSTLGEPNTIPDANKKPSLTKLDPGNPMGTVAVPQTQNKLTTVRPIDSLVIITISQENAKNSKGTELTARQLLLDTDKDPEEENSLFLRLVIDSGHNYFYFDIGGDWDEEEEEETEDSHPVDGYQNVDDNEVDKARRRRQSSLAVEAMNKWNFNYLDQAGVKKVAAAFAHLKPTDQEQKQWEAAERNSLVQELISETELNAFAQVPTGPPLHFMQPPIEIHVHPEVEPPPPAPALDLPAPPAESTDAQSLALETTREVVVVIDVQPTEPIEPSPVVKSPSKLNMQQQEGETGPSVEKSASGTLAEPKNGESHASGPVDSDVSFGMSQVSINQGPVPSAEQFATNVANEPIGDVMKSQMSVNMSGMESGIHDGMFGPGTGFRRRDAVENTQSDGPVQFLRQFQGTDAHPVMPRRDIHTVPYCFVCKRRIDPSEKHIHDATVNSEHHLHHRPHHGHHQHRDHGFLFQPEKDPKPGPK